MKLREITFKTPVKVFQVFRNVNVYGKSEKSYNDRKDKINWKEIYSKSGYVNGETLYLPEQIVQNPDFKSCDLISIIDNNIDDSFSTSDLKFTSVISSKHKPDYNQCYHLNHPNKFEIFDLRKNEHLELHLRYGYFEIGSPERENFKLCDITKNNPVEIKINGKTDFSLTSRRGRVFKEQNYIIEYLGDFEKCKLLKEPYKPTLKTAPTNRKIVNLIKPLW